MPIPKLLVSFQEASTLVSGWGSDGYQAVLRAKAPTFHADLSRPFWPDDGHGHDPAIGVALHEVIGALDDLPGGRCLACNLKAHGQ